MLKGHKLDQGLNGWKKGKIIPNIFLGLEKARTVRNTITQLKTDSGNLIDSQNQIHHKMTDYYKEVYKKKVNFKTEINQFNNFISNLNISQISNEDKTKCDEIITLTELEETFKLLNNKSAPGHDGLYSHILQTFLALHRTSGTCIFYQSFSRRATFFKSKESNYNTYP